MKTIIFFLTVLVCKTFGKNYENIPKLLSRLKRDATGALDILTNHAQPIHADVKNDNTGVGKVVPPKDNKGKSLRKSFPTVTSLDLVRAISRLVTLLALVFSAVVEFYPLVQNLYYTFYEFMYPNN